MVSEWEVGIELYQFLRVFLPTFTNTHQSISYIETYFLSFKVFSFNTNLLFFFLGGGGGGGGEQELSPDSVSRLNWRLSIMNTNI